MRRRATIIFFLITCALYFIIGGGNGVFWNSAVKIFPLLILLAGMSFSLAHRESRQSREAKALVLSMVAIVFSMLGDVVGEMDGTVLGNSPFVCQIAAFAAAQICYISSFALFFKRDSSFRRNVVRVVLALILLIYFICFAIQIVSFIEDDAVRVAVPVYMALLGLMALSSIFQCRRGQWWFISGAFFFFISDSMIAYRVFIGPLSNSGLLVMFTYYAAQLLLNYPYLKK